jgi:hypothetical protein
MQTDATAEPRSDAATSDDVFCSSCGTAAKRGTRRCVNRSCGVFLRRNPGRPQESGVVAFRRHGVIALPDDIRAEHDRVRAQVYADQGGESECTEVKKKIIDRFVQVDTIVNLLINDVATRGLLTAKGRARSSVDQLFRAIDRFVRLSEKIGLERQARKVGPQTLDDILAAPDEEP